MEAIEELARYARLLLCSPMRLSRRRRTGPETLASPRNNRRSVFSPLIRWRRKVLRFVIGTGTSGGSEALEATLLNKDNTSVAASENSLRRVNIAIRRRIGRKMGLIQVVFWRR